MTQEKEKEEEEGPFQEMKENQKKHTEAFSPYLKRIWKIYY